MEEIQKDSIFSIFRHSLLSVLVVFLLTSAQNAFSNECIPINKRIPIHQLISKAIKNKKIDTYNISTKIKKNYSILIISHKTKNNKVSYIYNTHNKHLICKKNLTNSRLEKFLDTTHEREDSFFELRYNNFVIGFWEVYTYKNQTFFYSFFCTNSKNSTSTSESQYLIYHTDKGELKSGKLQHFDNTKLTYSFGIKKTSKKNYHTKGFFKGFYRTKDKKINFNLMAQKPVLTHMGQTIEVSKHFASLNKESPLLINRYLPSLNENLFTKNTFRFQRKDNDYIYLRINNEQNYIIKHDGTLVEINSLIKGLPHTIKKI